jgi:hypothetical protein
VSIEDYELQQLASSLPLPVPLYRDSIETAGSFKLENNVPEVAKTFADLSLY